MKRRFFSEKPVLISVLLMMLISSLSISLAKRVAEIEEKECFARLAQEAENVVNFILNNAEQDTRYLELLALIAAKYENLSDQTLWSIFNNLPPNGMFRKIELLLPDDTVITGNGTRIDVSGRLSFEKTAARGIHITDRERDILNENLFVVRNCVPVIRDGQVAAVLCGIVELGTLPQEINLTPYGGAAAIYLIDGNTGDFLLDTWHQETGNIWELGKRPMAPGYDHEQLNKGLTDGESRYVVFVSKTIGEYLYFYYTPININQWRVALSVPENIVFFTVNKMRQMMFFIITSETVLFIIYFIWILRYSRKESDEKQHQLNIISYISDVEKSLFNAHEKEENVITALEKVGHMTDSEQTCFWMQDYPNHYRSYIWNKTDVVRMPHVDRNFILEMYSRFQDDVPEISINNPKELPYGLPFHESNRFKNLTAVPVKKPCGTLAGILAVCNTGNGHQTAFLLRSICFSFGLFCQNSHSFLMVKNEGERDALTGLYNRNRYEQDLNRLDSLYRTSLACIYIDVNGLHEVNNREGHQRGDDMLKAVAEHISLIFSGGHNIYRIGGDEFVILVSDMDESAVKEKTELLESILEEQCIYISAGYIWEKNVHSFEKMVRAAEKIMYAAKKRFYQQHKFNRRRPR